MADTGETAPIFDGYSIERTVGRNGDCLAFDAVREADGRPVTLHQLSPDFHGARALAQFHRELGVRRALAQTSVVANLLAFIDDPQQPVMVLERDQAFSLAEWSARRVLQTTDILEIAFALARSLDELHGEGLIHRALSPHNVRWRSRIGQVHLDGLHHATQLVARSDKRWNQLTGDLVFMSPEQTGRLNRKVDHRSDYYSMGVLLYWLFTGELPYASDDPVSVLTEIITASAPALHVIRPNVPEMVSLLVDRLLSKLPENRYQTGVGLMHDIDTCLRQIHETGSVHTFTLGRMDVSAGFSIPDKLYGRATEIDRLRENFHAIARGDCRLVLLTGHAGAGKTSLVGEVEETIISSDGILLSSKFDQFQHTYPFQAFIGAFAQQFSRVQVMDPAQRKTWRKRILDALGPNAAVVAAVIPGLTDLLGAVEPVQELDPIENQNRFRRTLIEFVRVFADKEHPLVLFLDDLQWADTTSLELLETCLCKWALRHCLIIGAYRDNEIGDNHPLIGCINAIVKSGVQVDTIELPPLKENDLQELLGDTLHMAPEDLGALPTLVLNKTMGNPYACISFIEALHANGDIRFDSNANEWQWDESEIAATSISHDVVDLLVDRITALPDATQTALQHGACVGGVFDLRTISALCGTSMTQLAIDLWPAVEAGLLIPTNANHDLLRSVPNTSATDRSYEIINASDKFQHDRVRQAAYEMMAPRERLFNHLRLGRQLVEKLNDSELEERLFDVTNHYNLAVSLVHDEPELLRMARLNLLTGRKALTSADYRAAFEFLVRAVEVLPANAWSEAHELATEVHLEAAEAAYLCGEYGATERLTDEIFAQTDDLLITARGQEIRLDALLSTNHMREAAEEGIRILRRLGVRLPNNPSTASVLLGLAETRIRLAGSTPENLSAMNRLADEKTVVIMRILNRMISAAYIASPTLFPMIVFRQVQLTRHHGLCAESASALILYGLVLSQATGNFELAYRYGTAGMQVLDRFGDYEHHARTYFYFYKFIWHWKRPVRETLDAFLKGYQYGIDHGDFEYGSYCAVSYFVAAVYCGNDLQGLHRSMPSYCDAIGRLNQETPHTYARIWAQYIANLADPDTADPATMTGPYYDESADLAKQQAAEDRTGLNISATARMRLAWMFGDHARAVELADEAERYMSNVQGIIDEPFMHFYTALVRASFYDQAGRRRRRALRRKIRQSRDKFALWNRFAPVNFASKLALVEAELARIEGQHGKVDALYQASIDSAREHGYLGDVAHTLECRGRWRVAGGKFQKARDAFLQSSEAYREWGALNKATRLAREAESLPGAN